MELASFKPFLSALALPPLLPLLMVLTGWIALQLTKQKIIAKGLMYAGFASIWLACCTGFAVLCNQVFLKDYPVATVQGVQANEIQAVVVLGSGLQTASPEYMGSAQLSVLAAARLRYGSILATQAKLPLAFSGGIGWSSAGTTQQTEAQAAQNYLQSFNLPAAKWLDGQSADTAENASEMSRIFKPLGINRVAIVTHDWHMERSVKLFEAQGFKVLPAPIYPIVSKGSVLFNWLPSSDGLTDTRAVLREALGLLVLKLTDRNNK